jgi:aminotransferase
MVNLSEREQHLPTHVIEKLIEMSAEFPNILSLGPGEPNFPLPPPLVSEVKRLANQSNHYSPAGGLKELRDAICKKVKRDNQINCSPNNVVVTCGSQEALLLSAASLLDVNEEILIPDPGFMGFLPSFEMFNANVKSYKLFEELNYEPDPDEIRQNINPRKTKAILINSPANPTGNVIRKKILEEIADIAVEFDLAILSDEAYEKILFDGAKHVSVGSLNGMSDRVLTFQTFSKTYAMCGFRLGYVVAPENIAKAIKKTHVTSTISAPTISQKLGIAALKLPSKYTDKMVREYDRRRKVMIPRLNDMGISTPMPKGAFYAFGNISPFGRNSKKFALDLLNKKKVAVVPGVDFGQNGEAHIRLSFASDMKVIEKALDRLEEFVRKR